MRTVLDSTWCQDVVQLASPNRTSSRHMEVVVSPTRDDGLGQLIHFYFHFLLSIIWSVATAQAYVNCARCDMMARVVVLF
jgi:hypothetical protein